MFYCLVICNQLFTLPINSLSFLCYHQLYVLLIRVVSSTIKFFFNKIWSCQGPITWFKVDQMNTPLWILWILIKWRKDVRTSGSHIHNSSSNYSWCIVGFCCGFCPLTLGSSPDSNLDSFSALQKELGPNNVQKQIYHSNSRSYTTGKLEL